MHNSRPSFVKHAPCSRAARIQKEIQSSPGMMTTQPPQSTRQILKSILKLMQDSKTSIGAKLQELFQLLSVMPSWPQWSPHADSIVGSTLAGLHPELAEDDDEKNPNSQEDYSNLILSSELIELNGNIPMLTHRILDESDERMSFVYLQWLHGVHAPQDVQCHVQDDDGTWLTDDELRRALKQGAELHIPTRTVGEPFNTRTNSALSPAVKDGDL